MGLFRRRPTGFEGGTLRGLGNLLPPLNRGDTLCLMTDASADTVRTAADHLTRAGWHVTVCRAAGDSLPDPADFAAPVTLALGSAALRDAVAARLPKKTTFVCLMERLTDYLTLSPAGTRPPDRVFCDPDLFPAAEDPGATVLAIHWGMVFDRGLFDMMYATHTAGAVAQRVTGMAQDLLRAEQDGSPARDYLRFGSTVGDALSAVTEGELTPAEALAVGMLTEARIAARAGIAKTPYLRDLDGVLTFRGLPREVEVPPAQWLSALPTDAEGSVTLYLPERIGACAPHSFTPTQLTRLYGKENPR